MIERSSVKYSHELLMTRSSGVVVESKIYFGEISNRYPYGGEKPVITISDLDGVFFESGKNDSFDQNVERLMALGDIAKKSTEIIFWTGRIENNKLSFFPFISREKIVRFKNFVKKANSDCDVSFKCGLSKVINGNGFDELVTEKINSGYEVVVIGSSIKDKKRVESLINIGKNICHYNTDRQFV